MLGWLAQMPMSSGFSTKHVEFHVHDEYSHYDIVFSFTCAYMICNHVITCMYSEYTEGTVYYMWLYVYIVRLFMTHRVMIDGTVTPCFACSQRQSCSKSCWLLWCLPNTRMNIRYYHLFYCYQVYHFILLFLLLQHYNIL